MLDKPTHIAGYAAILADPQVSTADKIAWRDAEMLAMSKRIDEFWAKKLGSEKKGSLKTREALPGELGWTIHDLFKLGAIPSSYRPHTDKELRKIKRRRRRQRIKRRGVKKKF
jgi:hypothetical protein